MGETIRTEYASEQYGFSYIHALDDGGNPVAHTDKDLFSVFMLLAGKIDYDIEGRIIHIKPNDILLVGNNELHRSIMDKKCEYRLLMVNLNYFIKNNCTAFSEMVFNRSPGDHNVIPAKTVTGCGISDIFARLDNYCAGQDTEPAVINAVIIELLYHLNKHVIKSGHPRYGHQMINEIIAYINDHLTERMTLDNIANTFFITKQHLCKLFKKNTGYTVNRYIAYKRIVLVREAYAKGLTLSEACYKAGFNDYSSFYRAYSKITSESPRNNLSKR